jgi:hypothetical protein
MKFQILFLATTFMAASIGSAAVASDIVYRFKAELAHTSISPPPTSPSAKAAEIPAITGNFGFSPGAERIAGASNPGRVTFADYATGSITIDQFDISALVGEITTEIRDGVTQTDDPKTTIPDQMTIGYRNFSAEEPIDSLTLGMLYKNADILENAAIPSSLNFEDFASIRILFSTRIDGSGNRNNQVSGSVEVLVLVSFRVTEIEQIE